jgi:hypothetical protein
MHSTARPYDSAAADPDPHGSALIWLSWIRIRIGNADPDPGIRKFIKINRYTWFLAFRMAFVPT